MTINKLCLRHLLFCLCASLFFALPRTGISAEASNCPLAEARITHVVIVWLKHPGSAWERRKLIEASKSLKGIPGVTGVAVGPVLVSKRPGVDSSFDVALIMGFKDKKSLAAYVKNPIHQKAVKEVLAPLASKYVIYDFVNE